MKEVNLSIRALQCSGELAAGLLTVFLLQVFEQSLVTSHILPWDTKQITFHTGVQWTKWNILE